MRLVGIVSILLWSAQTVPAQAEKSGERCSLEGRVLDLTTSQPLRNVRLTLRSLDRNNVAAATSSNDSGAFLMENIEPGQYWLSGERNGYNRQEYGTRGQSSRGTVLTLAPRQQLTDLQFNLVPYGVVAGRIVDEDSEPVAGAQVSVYRYSWSKGKRRLTSAGGSATNDLGEYRVYGLGSGRYVVSASPRPARDVDPAPEARADKVQTETAYIPTYYSGTGDASSATPVDLGPGTKLQGINFHVLSVPMARIRGRVTNHAGVEPGGDSITVYAFPKGGGLAGMRSTSVRDAKGGFELRGVPPGSYMLVASFVQNRRLYSGTLRLEVPAGQTLDGVNIEIGPGVEVGGSVRVEGDAPVKLGGITILLEPKGIESMMETTSRGIAENGTIQAASVPPGEYDIDVVGLPDEVYLKSILLSRQDVTDSGIGVQPSGGAYRLEIALSTAGGVVEVAVKDEKDRPAAGAQVLLAPDEPHWNHDRLFKSATTDQNGQCVMKGVAPGDYKLFAWEGVETESVRDPDVLRKLFNLGEPVSVREKERSSKQLKLTPDSVAVN